MKQINNQTTMCIILLLYMLCVLNFVEIKNLAYILYSC